MKLRAKRASAAALILAVIGCGGGGANNDGGAGVTLVGFTSTENNICSETVFVSAVAMPISGGGSADGQLGDVGIFSCFQAQNNLVTQAVRVDRAMLRYYVAGASQQPPSTVTAVAAYLPAATGITSLPNQTNSTTPGTKPQGTLPSGASGASTSRVTYGFAVVPSAVREWISAHRAELPPAPFNMIAEVQLSGVTSAGDRIETNEAGLTVIVTEDNLF